MIEYDDKEKCFTLDNGVQYVVLNLEEAEEIAEAINFVLMKLQRQQEIQEDGKVVKNWMI